MIRTRTFTSIALALGLGAVASSACTGSQPTELVSGVSTQMRVPEDIKTVGVVVQRGGQVVFCQGYDVDAEQLVDLPATTALEPVELADGQVLSNAPVTTTYYGFTERDAFQDCIAAPEPKQVATGDAAVDKDNEAVPSLRVMRRARTPYADGRVLYLPMALRDACAGVACTGEDQACVGGSCVTIDVPTESLRDFRDDFVNAGASTCFQAEKCFGGQTVASLTDPGSCSFTIATPPDATLVPGTTNVIVTYDTLSYEVLDLDAAEGFIVDDPTKPQSFRLAPNLCAGPYAKGRIVSVSGAVGAVVNGKAVGCESKPATQPICTKDLEDIQKGKTTAGEGSGSSVCTVPGSELQAADSALYLLFDRSQAMAQFLNNQEEFQKAIQFTIDNPITRATRVAFGFVPAVKEGNTCGSGAVYSDPRDVEPGFGKREPQIEGEEDFATDGFALADRAQAAISSQLSFDTSQATINPNLADADAQLAFDEVMREDGAYAALEKLQSERGFNRRAIVILSNSLPAAECDGNDPESGERVNTLIELAEAAKKKDLFTYWVPLVRQGERDAQGNPLDANGFQDDETFTDSEERLGAAQQIAAAGGTIARDATNPSTGAVEGLRALQGIVNDLGSCVYNTAQNPIVNELLKGDAAQLSYVSPVDFARVDIAKNEACTAESQAEFESNPGSASTNSGWNLDGEFVRICGTACSELRERLATTSTSLGAIGLKAPSVPILVTRACE